MNVADYLVTYSRHHRDVWKSIAMLRRELAERYEWPPWCWMPMAPVIVSALDSTYDFIKQKVGESDMIVRFLSTVVDIYVLSAWRVGQGIYRFDPDLYQALLRSDIDSSIPTSVLFRLPEYGVYVETPGMVINGERSHGFFAALSSSMVPKTKRGLSQNEKSSELGENALFMVFDVEKPNGARKLSQMAYLRLEKPTLGESLEDTFSVHDEWVAGNEIAREMLMAYRKSFYDGKVIMTLANLLLYLCSEQPDVVHSQGDPSLRPQRASPIKTKDGPRWIPPNKPTRWEVGFRMGAQLRLAREARERSAGVPLGDGEEVLHRRASPRPHVRRAHWHGYWLGSRQSPDRRFVLRWIPPVMVNARSPSDLVPTVRRVDARTRSPGESPKDPSPPSGGIGGIG